MRWFAIGLKGPCKILRPHPLHPCPTSQLFVLVVAALSKSHITMSMLFLAVCIDEEKVSSRLGNVRRQISERKNAELYHLQPNKLLAVER